MGYPLSRLGDRDSGGGRIKRAAITTFCNGIRVGLHVSPLPPHSGVTTSASPDVICEGCPVIRITSTTSCGHIIVEGSKDTIVS